MPKNKPTLIPGEILHTDNARVARNLVREVYGGYLLGNDIFPRARILTPDHEHGPRVRPVARLLQQAWRNIDCDEAFFWGGMQHMENRLVESETDGRALVVARAGINAVRFGTVSLTGETAQAQYMLITGPDVKPFFSDFRVGLSDGRVTTMIDGVLDDEPCPDLVLIRRPGVSASYYEAFARPEPQAA